MPARVRVLTADDDAAFASLWQSAVHARRGAGVLTVTPVAGTFKPQLSRPEVFGVGIFEEAELVSAAVALPTRADDGRSQHMVPGLAHVSSVATAPDRWGRGLAGMAVRAVMWNAVRLGYARVQLWTHTTNRGAHALYRREGFVLSGREKAPEAHDGERIVHYIRELPSPRLVLGRAAARILCLDENDRVLLMHWRQPLTGSQLWEPPGGGIEPGETLRQAVLREWREETGGGTPRLVGEPTTVARDVMWGDVRFVGDEQLFLGRYATGPAGVATAFTAGEQASH
ncbi:MAG: GNAT family N-acetyltransferase, partial [Nocardioidaceae bacterium]|nr:GNAT family N-acetyltransferase [Nocardioidaceae bacterium]